MLRQITLTHPPWHKGRVYVRGLWAKNSDSRCAVSTSRKRHRLPVMPGTLPNHKAQLQALAPDGLSMSSALSARRRLRSI